MHPPPIFTFNQSTPFHLKRSCLRSDFSPLISSKPQVLKRRSIEKREKEEEKVLKKEKKKESSKSLFK
jgi:hypothetical protein